jgi:hypothetical protein
MGCQASVLGVVILLVLIIVVMTEGSYRLSRRVEAAHAAELTAERAGAQKALGAVPESPPELLQPRYDQSSTYHHPQDPQPWLIEHRVGVFNPAGQPARRVRMYLVRMEPYPRNVLPGYPGPVIPYTVPLQRGGDPNAGLTIGSKQEELWIIGYTGTGSDGKMNAGGFAAPDYRWRGLPWQFDPDERWRLSYEIVCDGRPDLNFSIVVTAENGHIRCDLEG